MVSFRIEYSIDPPQFTCISLGQLSTTYTLICSPAGEPLNDSEAGTGTSTSDWIDLVIGEGGVIDWLRPGWRGEYTLDKKSL